MYNQKFNQNLDLDTLCKTFGKLYRNNEKPLAKGMSIGKSQIEDKWLIDNYNKYSRTKLCEEYNKTFNKNLYYRSLENYSSKLIKLGLIERKNKPVNRFRITEEMREWIVENKSKYYVKEFVEEFNKKFNCKTSYDSLKRNLLTNGIKTSQLGKRAKIDRTNFHKYKIGDIVKYHNINWIKVNNLSLNRLSDTGQKNFKKYADYVYEKHHNIVIPKDKIVLHLDGNTLNDDINNLMLVSKPTFISINCRKKYLKEIKGLIEVNALAKEIEKQLKELEI